MTKAALILIAVLFLAIQPAHACDPNEECSTCLIPNPFGGCIQYGNAPDCELRKAACQECANIKAAATGLSLACVGCVMVSTPANPACVATCGGAANAEAVELAADCGN